MYCTYSFTNFTDSWVLIISPQITLLCLLLNIELKVVLSVTSCMQAFLLRRINTLSVKALDLLKFVRICMEDQGWLLQLYLPPLVIMLKVFLLFQDATAFMVATGSATGRANSEWCIRLYYTLWVRVWYASSEMTHACGKFSITVLLCHCKWSLEDTKTAPEDTNTEDP